MVSVSIWVSNIAALSPAIWAVVKASASGALSSATSAAAVRRRPCGKAKAGRRVRRIARSMAPPNTSIRLASCSQRIAVKMGIT